MTTTGLTYKNHKLVKKVFLRGKIEYTYNDEPVSGAKYAELKKSILQARADSGK